MIHKTCNEFSIQWGSMCVREKLPCQAVGHSVLKDSVPLEHRRGGSYLRGPRAFSRWWDIYVLEEIQDFTEKKECKGTCMSWEWGMV